MYQRNVLAKIGGINDAEMLATNEKDALKFKIAALQRSNEVLLEESRKVQFGFEGGGSEIDPSRCVNCASVRYVDTRDVHS